MRYIIPVLLAAFTMAPMGSPASAQTAPSGVLTPAPVPNRDRSIGAPADRAGRADGAERAAPFSGLPNTLSAGSGEPSPVTGSAADRSTAPAPALSK